MTLLKSTYLFLLLVSLTLITGCANYAGLHPQSIPLNSTDLSLTSTLEQWPDEQWWLAYDDELLSELMAQALKKNPSIQITQARLAQVAAMTKSVFASTMPEVNFDASMRPERFTENSIYPPPFAGAIYSNNSLMVNAGYEVDFWGKHRAALAAALSTEQAAAAELQSARLLIATSVAKSYFSLARLLEQKKISEVMLGQRQELLALTQQRLQAGLDTQQEFHLSKENLPTIRTELIRLDEQINLTRHALAALMGQGPQATQQLIAKLPHSISMAVPDDIPADLIGRRADISAARFRVEAAGKQIEVAQAAFYPNINLSAFAGLNSLGFHHWLDKSSRDYGAGVAIHLPIFDAGRLRAHLSGKDAEYDIAVESYNQTLLEAIRDVADQLNSWHALAEQRKQQNELQSHANSIYELTQKREQAGLISKLAVLGAQSNVLLQQSNAIDLKARALDLTINLNRALGGGFVGASTRKIFTQQNP